MTVVTEILSPNREAAAVAAETAAWYEDQNNTSRRISFGAGDNNRICPNIHGIQYFFNSELLQYHVPIPAQDKGMNRSAPVRIMSTFLERMLHIM